MTTTAVPVESTRQAQTRARLLEAAAQEFADHGYHHATVREICKKADANVAAVNYHFGDKCGLYAATIKHWIGVSLDKFPPLMGVSPDAPVAQRLRGFVEGSLSRMLDTGSAGWHGQLMAREMVEPTEAFDYLVQETIRPMCDLLHSLVRDVAGVELDEQTVRSCAMSVIGQCCFYKHAREVVSRLHGDIYGGDFIRQTAEHITQFSMAGIKSAAAACQARAIASQREGGPK